MKIGTLAVIAKALTSFAGDSPSSIREKEYKKSFERDFQHRDYAQYRRASSWEIAHNAASHLGRVDTANPSEVLQASVNTAYAKRFPDTCRAVPLQHEVDLTKLIPGAAKEFYFDKMGIHLSKKQTQEVMRTDLKGLLRSISYYTLSWPQRAVVFGLGRAPSLPAAAYIAEYARQGYATDFWVFQDICRRL